MTRVTYIIAAIALVAAFFGLGATDPGLEIGFIPSWTNSTPGELYTWLGIVFLILPASWLFGLGLQPQLTKICTTSVERIRAAHAANPAALLLGFFIVGLIFAMAGNRLVLHGFPFTDDEWAARYAGQLMAMGQLMEPVPSYFPVMPRLFFYLHDGMMTAFDWLGAVWPWTVAELTYLGNDFFALMAAGTFAAFGALITRRLGPVWAVVGVVFLMVSPMGASLSVTTHAHLISRAFLCFSLLAYLAASEKNRAGLYFLTGLLGGMGWMTRPAESTMLWLPLAVLIIFDGIRNRDRRLGLGLFLLGGAIPVAVFFAHSFAVTGTLLPPRMAPNDLAAWTSHHKPPFEFLKSFEILKSRLGANISYNLFMLTIWAFGPVALGLAWLGARTDRFTKALALGILCDLALGILHDDYGLHMVGPIHYSETIIPILILVIHGLNEVKNQLKAHAFEPMPWLATIITALVLSNGFFATRHLQALEKQGRIHDTIYSYFDDPKFDNSIVFGPEYGTAWRRFPEFRKTGSFVFQWRRVDPRRTERVVFMHMPRKDLSFVQKVHDAYPSRNIFVIRLQDGAPYMSAEPLPL